MKFDNLRGWDQFRWNTKALADYEDVHRDDVIALHVADSDLPLPKKVIKKIVARANYPYFAYHILTDEFQSEFHKYLLKHQIEVNENEYFFTPGTVVSAAFVIQALTKENDKVILSTPIYGPLYETPKLANRQVIDVPLIKHESSFSLDFKNLELMIKKEKPKMLIFCSPHNPAGIVFTVAEMKKIIQICRKAGIYLLVDEIHIDINLYDITPVSFGSMFKDYDKIIIISSVNKTYNLAGIQNGWIIAKNPLILQKIKTLLAAFHISSVPNIFAQAAAVACWEDGDQFLKKSKRVYEKNIDYLVKGFKKNHSNFKPVLPQATFLLYVSYESFNISEVEMKKLMRDKYGVVVHFASNFYDPEAKYFRINVATPFAVIQETLKRLLALEKELMVEK